MQDAALSADAPPARGRPARVRAALVALVVLAMVVVVVASAWLRLSQQAACDSWPACRSGAMAPVEVAAAVDALQGAARLAHRGSATLVLLAALALVALTWRARSDRATRPAGELGRAVDTGSTPDVAVARFARALLVIALALAALGIATRAPASAWAPQPALRAAMMLGNLLGGLAMLALAWSLWRTLRGAAALPAAARRLARVAALLWCLQAAAGALSGAGAAAAAPLVHLLLALVTLPCTLWLGWTLRHGVRATEARALLVLVMLQPLLGVAALAGAAAAPLVWLHNAGAAAGLALLAGLALAGPVTVNR